MTDATSPCPPLSSLLLFSDGEVSTRERRKLASHFWRCSSCRERLAAFESLAEESAAAIRVEDIADVVPDPFVVGLHQHVRQQPVLLGPSRPWLAVAAAVPVLVLILVLSRSHTAVLNAEELLERAAAVESATSAMSLPASLSWQPDSIATTAVERGQGRKLGSGLVASQMEPDPAAMTYLRAYGVDQGRAFSIKPFRMWRAGLRERQDEIRDGGELLVLRTTTRAGAIRMAEATVHRQTFTLVRLTFVVDGRGRLDIEPGQSDEGAPTKHEASVIDPLVAAPTAVSRDALEQAELQARLILRATDIDLDRAVRLVPDVGRGVVRIEGVKSPTVRRTLTEMLPEARHIELAAEAGGGVDREEEGTRVNSTEPLSEEMSRWLDRTYGAGESEPKRRFLPELRRTATLTVERLEALDALAQRYPEAVVRGLSVSQQGLLKRLVRQHYMALIETLDEYGSQVAVLSGTTPPLCIALTEAPMNWRARAKRSLAPARELKRLFALESAVSADTENRTSGEQAGGAGSAVRDGWRADATSVRLAFTRLWNDINR